MLELYQDTEDLGLGPDSRFNFDCLPGLACFNECCRRTMVLLSPYDAWRLKGAMGISSGEFLRRHTIRMPEERSRLPLIFLKPPRGQEQGCPLVNEEGCTVYEHRPAVCRLFPITQGSSLTEEGMADYYYCRRLDYCQGFDQAREWTVAAWKAAQGFDQYDAWRGDWLEMLLRQGERGPGAVQLQDLFYLSLYDQDNFRQFVFDSAFLRVHDL